jgi:hypothetical protein
MQSLKLIVLLAVFVSSCFTSAEAYCDKYPTVEEEFRSSNIVVIGTVIRSTDIFDSDGFISGTFYSIRVSEVLKGRPGKTVDLYSENSSGRFPMDGRVSYLVFAYKGVFEGVKGSHLAVDSCGNSGTLKDSGKTLVIVRKLRTRPVTVLRSTR